MDLLAAIIDMITTATTQPVTPELVLTDFNDLIGNDPRSDDVILANESPPTANKPHPAG